MNTEGINSLVSDEFELHFSYQHLTVFLNFPKLKMNSNIVLRIYERK